MNLDFEVRDYECDIQGIVNNAVYLNYLEHARHKFLLSKRVDFIKLARENKNLVLIEAKYKYHKALRPDDKFTVTTKVFTKSKISLLFEQKIFRNNELILEAELVGVCVDYISNKIYRLKDVLAEDLFL